MSAFVKHTLVLAKLEQFLDAPSERYHMSFLTKQHNWLYCALPRAWEMVILHWVGPINHMRVWEQNSVSWLVAWVTEDHLITNTNFGKPYFFTNWLRSTKLSKSSMCFVLQSGAYNRSIFCFLCKENSWKNPQKKNCSCKKEIKVHIFI